MADLYMAPLGSDPDDRDAWTHIGKTDSEPATVDAGRLVTAITRFRGGPGREAEAAEAWAFELTYYFRRRVGEQPRVVYEGGVYTCTGLMTTTHPGDAGPVVEFDKGSPPWDLDFAVNTDRQKSLREMYEAEGSRWGGS